MPEKMLSGIYNNFSELGSFEIYFKYGEDMNLYLLIKKYCQKIQAKESLQNNLI